MPFGSLLCTQYSYFELIAVNHVPVMCLLLFTTLEKHPVNTCRQQVAAAVGLPASLFAAYEYVGLKKTVFIIAKCLQATCGSVYSSP